MAFINIKVDATQLSIGDLNAKITGNSKPQEGVIELRNLMDAIVAGTVDASVAVVTSTGDLTVTGETGPTQSATYNLK